MPRVSIPFKMFLDRVAEDRANKTVSLMHDLLRHGVKDLLLVVTRVKQLTEHVVWNRPSGYPVDVIESSYVFFTNDGPEDKRRLNLEAASWEQLAKSAEVDLELYQRTAAPSNEMATPETLNIIRWELPTVRYVKSS